MNPSRKDFFSFANCKQFPSPSPCLGITWQLCIGFAKFPLLSRFWANKALTNRIVALVSGISESTRTPPKRPAKSTVCNSLFLGPCLFLRKTNQQYRTASRRLHLMLGLLA